MSKANTGAGANADPVPPEQQANGQYGRSEAQVVRANNDKERAEEERQIRLNKGDSDMNDAIKAEDDRERA